jgi:hypothetical protein
VQAVTSAALLPMLLRHHDKIKMVNEIHDSKWFIIKEEYLGLIIPQLKSIMEDIPTHFKELLKVEFPFKIPVVFETGPNFIETVEYNQEETSTWQTM